jgi:hypothetical protein
LRHRAGGKHSGKRDSQKKFLHGCSPGFFLAQEPSYHQSKPMKARVLLRFIAGLREQALKAGPSDREPAPGT